MATHSKLLNITTNKSYRLTRIMRGINEGAWKWKEFGLTVESLTPLEAIAFRNAQAAIREPLPVIEIPGLVWNGPKATDFGLIRAAHEFCASAA